MKFKNILIVDDSLTARMMIINYLQIVGQNEATFFEANDGSVALSLLDENKVDLIITDIIMPKIDGNVFVQKVRLNPGLKQIPIIILTSLGKDGVKTDPLDQLIYIIQKPISPEKLSEVLEGIEC